MIDISTVYVNLVMEIKGSSGFLNLEVIIIFPIICHNAL